MLIVSILLAAGLVGQDLPPISAASDYAHLNRSMTAPRLVHSTEPEYTPQAVSAHIEGTVVLQVIIGLNGRVTNASVLIPLPAGLDQKALESVKNWRYEPGSMDTVTIPILTTIDVLFRLPYQSHRAPAPPLPSDPQQAAFLGDTQAQLSLAERYEHGRNLPAARRYYRLCAATANPTCQYHLGNLLVTGDDVNPNDFSQGVAWLELSKEHGNRQAASLWETAKAKLSDIQKDWVAELKPHMEVRSRVEKPLN